MSRPRPNLAEQLDAALPVALRHIPQRIRDVAEQLDLRVALVGGVPRDLLRIQYGQLSREQYLAQRHDFDVVVQGDAIAFGYELVRRLPGRLVLNKDFGTATLTTGDPAEIDLTSARREDYPTPGYLPVVILGATIEEDLARRDFTVSSTALELGGDYGSLIDVIGGAADIEARLIRTLHSGSFQDDPTRLFRAMRYSFRLNYDFEPVTKDQLTEAIDDGNVDSLSPERVRHELELIGRESRWADIWQVMHFSGLLHALHPALLDIYTGWQPTDARAVDNGIRARGELLDAGGVEPWLVRTTWALGGVQTPSLESVCRRIGLFERHSRWVMQARELLRDAFNNNLQLLTPSLACDLLEKYPRQAALLAIFTFQPRTDEEVELRRTLLRYIEEWSEVRSELSSDELRELGLSPGPQFGQLRKRLRHLRLDGIISDVEEEREYARRHIAESADAESDIEQ